jgi:ribonucleotide reductase beta subunit family protein with ferritin-like domain
MTDITRALRITGPHRLATFPISPNHLSLWMHYLKQLESFWAPSEIDFSRDLSDYDRLDANEKSFLLRVLGFFAIADSLVNENLVTRFKEDIDIREARAFFSLQCAIEEIHSHTYSLMVDSILLDSEERSRVLDAASTFATIARKKIAIEKYMDAALPIADRLVAFACVEGLSFSASFASIFFFRKRNLFPGITLGNQFIIRDEALHTDFTINLFREHVLPQDKPTQARVHEIVEDFVSAEIDFVWEALPTPLRGLSAADLEDYTLHVADSLCARMGYDAIYKRPFPDSLRYMDTIGIENKTNFFERRVSEYRKAGLAGGDSAHQWNFATEEEF